MNNAEQDDALRRTLKIKELEERMRKAEKQGDRVLVNHLIERLIELRKVRS